MMRMNRLTPLAAVIAAALGASPALAGKANDTVTWSTTSEVDTADLYYQNLREVVIIAHQVCDTLMHRNSKTNEYEPLLASDYKWVDDVTLDFTLRPGVKFHNGKPFGAEDVAYTFGHVSKAENGAVTQLVVDWVKSVDVVAADKVRFHLKAPTPAALEYLSGVTPIYPKGHYDNAPEVPGADGKKRRDWGAVQPMCTGPYKITRFVPGQTVVMEKNADYFKGGPKGTPKIGKLVFRTIADSQAMIAELMTGGLDWIWDVPKDNAEQFARMPNLTIKQAPTMRISFLSLDAAGRTGDNPLKDVRVRKALNYAIDRKAIATNLVGTAAQVLDTACYPSQFGCSQDVTKYEYSPAKAKALLAEAGFANGFTMPIYSYRDRGFTEAVIGYLRAVGITADLKYMQWRALRPILETGKAELAHLSWGSQAINNSSASVSNYFKFSEHDYARDPEIKAWLETADGTANSAKRKEAYGKALKKIADQAYWVPLFSYARYYAYTSDLNFEPSPDELANFYASSWK